MAASERTPLLPPSEAVQETQLSGSNGTGEASSHAGVAPSSSSTRQLAPDLLRGVLMCLMAIDHTSVSFGAYSHGTGIVSEAASTVVEAWNGYIPYTIRTMTHLCAGGFAMLMGMGIAYFVASRRKATQHQWSTSKQLWHFTMRAIAMLLVNLFGWQLVVAIQGRWLWMFNIVLVALAIDYLVVGMAYVGIVYYVEPVLQGVLQRILPSTCEDAAGEEEQTSRADTSTQGSPAGTVTRTIIDGSLLSLAVLSLWASIWTSPNQGACLEADRLQLPDASTQDATLHLLGHIIPPPKEDYCQSAGRLFFGFMFQQVQCIEQRFLSSFPPVGWLPFVLIGVVYGRALLRLSSPSRVSALNLSLCVFFALLFISTRVLQYGNLSTHCVDTPDQHSSGHTTKNQYLTSFRSFFYIVKYPPSPAFAFGTLSGNFLLLYIFNVLSSASRAIDAVLRDERNPLLVFGNNPLFFYGAHGWYLFAVTALYLHTNLPGSHPNTPPSAGWGLKPQVGLGGIFVSLYVSLLVLMYFVCRSYGSWKKKKGRESVWRFL